MTSDAGQAVAAVGEGGPADVPGPEWAGAPLRSTLRFLLVPTLLGVGVMGFGLPLPSWALYGTAAVLGAALVARTFTDPEWLIAAFILYIPLSRMFVVPLVPGVNGTNALEALLLLAWAVHAGKGERPAAPMPFTRLVTAWAVLSLTSVLTAAVAFGPGFVLDHSSDLKQWIDQFIVFFALVHLIRDGAQARRAVLYMMLGGAVVLALGFQEWVDKRWMSTIEKSRLLGPQLQPNDFGAFVVYGVGPLIGVLLTRLRRPRAWLVMPYLLLTARILLSTFSRGAFIGMAAAGVAAAWVRGKTFVILVTLLAGTLLVAAPELLPQSLTDRMSSTREGDGSGELDASSQTRLVLWKAAVDMTLESPLLGKGFKAFPRLKAAYAEADVPEADNHNMFLYVASQMGLPALIVFLWILLRAYRTSARVYRRAADPFGRAIGLGGAAMVAGVLAVNMFGSRMVDVAVHAYVWIYLAVLAHLALEVDPPAGAPDGRDPAGGTGRA